MYHEMGLLDDRSQLLAVKKTTRITIETEQLVVIGRKRSVRVWCEQCTAEVDLVPIEGAAELAGVDLETIRSLLTGEAFHLSQSGGPVRICLNSLLKSISGSL